MKRIFGYAVAEQADYENMTQRQRRVFLAWQVLLLTFYMGCLSYIVLQA
jgi:hypothetical protein